MKILFVLLVTILINLNLNAQTNAPLPLPVLPVPLKNSSKIEDGNLLIVTFVVEPQKIYKMQHSFNLDGWEDTTNVGILSTKANQRIITQSFTFSKLSSPPRLFFRIRDVTNSPLGGVEGVGYNYNYSTGSGGSTTNVGYSYIFSTTGG